MKATKWFVSGLAAGIASVLTIAYAGQGQVSILPTEVYVLNRPNQPVPVRQVESFAVRTLDTAPLKVTLDSSKVEPAKWEYRVYTSAQDLMTRTATTSFQAGLNKLGNEGWELVGEFTFKRRKA